MTHLRNDKVLVLDSNKVPLMPCKPARARQLLARGMATIVRFSPFTILLNKKKQSDN